MSSPNFDIETSELATAINQRLSGAGSQIASSIYSAAIPILSWINYLHTSELTGHCDEFLDGLRASIVETIGCGASGLVRPSIYSMRTQIDIILSWLYFKDHPVEWTKVEDTGEGFVLKRDALEYLKSNIRHFEARLAALTAKRTRQLQDPYKILSAHVHAQGLSVLPNHGKLMTLIGTPQVCSELAPMQVEVAEYIGDVLLSCFGPKWASLPEPLVTAAKARLEEKQISVVFS
ncbi:MAG: hypothetical protein EON58_02845 [Alphaproteobacteria bacterium]|nr:MAG: hypothetical protein EON58_02845 [Alphaproteobacteria bacterium]